MNVASYASKIDQAIDKANEDMMRTVQNMDGSISGNPNLDGFITLTKGYTFSKYIWASVESLQARLM